MLQQILVLFRRAEGRPLSKEAVRAELELPPDVLDHMLRTLVRRGRLVAVEGGCEGCEICPLKPVCAGVPAPTQKAYALPQPDRDGRRSPISATP